MSDLKIQGEVQISAEGAESALDRVADKAGQMARRMEAEGAKAGKAVDGIGAGADKSAEQFTRAEGRMSESIKRATKNLQELGKTASQKIELRIAERGLDPARFEPMLVKLRELEAAQIKVATSSPRMGGGLQNLSYQMQDMIVQVNGGTDAMRAMSMQLPQMLIGFGAAGAAIGVVAALLPNLISAFGGAGENTKKFSDAMSDFDKAIGDVGSTVKKFDLDPLYEQFNDSSAAVRAATIEQIKFQQEYIKTTQLVAQKKFGESVGGLGSYGTLDKLLGAAGNTPADNLAKQLGVQLEVAQELLPVLRGLNKGTEDVGLAFEKTGQKLLGGNQRAVDLAKSLADMAKAERDAAAASSALSEAQEKMAKGHVTTKDEAKKAADLAKKQAEELENLLNTINAKASDFDTGYVKNVEMLLLAFDRGKLSLGAFNDVFARYVAMQPGAVAAEKERAKALDAAWKAEVKLIEEMGKETDTLEKQVAQARLENEQIGLTKEQLNALKLARLDDAIATKEQALAMAEKHSTSATEIELIRDQVEALKELRGVTASSQVKQANADALKEQQEAWKKFSDDIERSLTDSLYRSFESGEDFGKAFVQSLQNTIKAAALKLAVQVVVSTGTGAVSQALGMGNTLQMGSSAYNLLGAGGTAYSTGAYMLGGMGYEQASMLAAQEMGLGATSATLEAAGASSLSAISSALPYIGAALAIGSLLMKDGGGPKSGGDAGILGGTLQADAGLANLYTPNDANATVAAMMATFDKGLTATISKLGGSSSSLGLMALGYDTDPNGTAGNRITSRVNGDVLSLNRGVGDIEAGLSEEMNRMFLAALKEVDLADWADALVAGIDPATASAEQLAAVIGQINTVMAERAAADQAWVQQFNAAVAEAESGMLSVAQATAKAARAAALSTDALLAANQRTLTNAAVPTPENLAAYSGAENLAVFGINKYGVADATAQEALLRRLDSGAVRKLVRRVEAMTDLIAGRYVDEAIGNFMVASGNNGLVDLATRFSENALGMADIGSTFAALDAYRIPKNMLLNDPAAGSYYASAAGNDVDGIVRVLAIDKAISDLDRSAADYSQQRALLRKQQAIAGWQSVEYYFDELGSMADALADASKAASEPIAQLTDTIGRLKSAAFVFGGSTSAMANGYGSRYGATTEIAQAIAAAATDATTWLNTQGGTALAQQFGADPRFAGVDWQTIGPMLDSVSAFNVTGYEAAFVRLSDALVDGTLNVEQYNALLAYGKDAFLGLATSVDAAANAVGSLVSMLDGALGTLDAQRQYDLLDRQAALAQVGSALAIAQAGGGLPSADSISEAVRILQTDAQNLYASASDYERDRALSRNTLGNLRDYAATHPDSTVSDVVTELQALRAEVAALRAEAQATAISSNTTARILNRVTKDGESLTTSPLV